MAVWSRRCCETAGVRGVFAAVIVGIVVWTTWPAGAQVTIPTSPTTTTRRQTTTTQPATTTTAPGGGGAVTTTTRRGATTTAPTTTAPPRTTSTIPTPAPSPATTAAPEPLAKHSGRFSPVFSWLFALGLLSGIGLLVLQWFLTRPGRHGWTL